MEEHTFKVELLFEPSFDSVEVTVDWETDDPDAIIDGYWPEGFADYILQNISIVPTSYLHNV